MLRAKAFHPEYLHHFIWACPRLVRGLRPPPSRIPLQVEEERLVSMIQRDARLRDPPPGFHSQHLPPWWLPRLNPFVAQIRNQNQTAYASVDGAVQLTLGQLGGIGTTMFDERWIELLCTFPPMDHAYDMGLNERSPQTLKHLVEWLMKLTC
jgi:hypothetical protein